MTDYYFVEWDVKRYEFTLWIDNNNWPGVSKFQAGIVKSRVYVLGSVGEYLKYKYLKYYLKYLSHI